MGSYEREQAALQKLWEECMSDDESNISEFGDVYLSDEYKPKSDEETSSDNDILVERAKRRKTSIKDLGDNAAGPYTAEHNISVDAEDTIQNVIEDVISQYAIESEDEEMQTPDSGDNINWGPVDGSSLKHFGFAEADIGIKPEFYENYDQEPYDFFKLFITDEIIEYMVYQTNLYAEQVLKEKPTAKGHVKK
ncbi:unnamed protein product [Acanthoscelides obtectus]|uniref:Uncharacterized protein n=1 Tax=Acanthoscelides obtectus TaxID=200917 RepID=A0A9P0K271_ACAOB|nr:unnamed protein product [Acanthoscelides obtectus]CAK1629681.1 hypothetical protein AOBTE_LOCUS5890 [Acanthoscelides obtectus]